MQRTLTLAGLALITLLLALVVVFEPGKSSPPESPPLTALKVADITAVEIERKGQPAVELRRVEGLWRLTAPFEAVADNARVNEALQVLEAKSEKQQAVAAVKLAEFGLESPELTLKVGETSLEFGNSHPLNQQRHIRLGDTIHRVQDFYFYQLNADPAGWVAQKLLPPGATLTGIELPGRTLTLGEDGKWTGPAAGNELPAAEIAAAFGEAEAFRVEVPTEPAASPPDADTLLLRFADGHIQRYLIMSREPELTLMTETPRLAWTFFEAPSRKLLGLAPVAPTASEAPEGSDAAEARPPEVMPAPAP